MPLQILDHLMLIFGRIFSQEFLKTSRSPATKHVEESFSLLLPQISTPLWFRWFRDQGLLVDWQ
jgi:hypothetical protein